ncbi:hypothetical protein [Cohnella rhizosphaerae]|uniref:DUF4367 domain-containing protein n=1 Tax=Cohnella rhizosphaerae TaxID=1457232 RepID=A0A9X4KTW9_9BACL|nr:hypothetical protein [Cohnella rhizosphaerae]MDG0808162.1 DUF4367 domain-containing protein [Cohnella rhizosphaerae]
MTDMDRELRLHLAKEADEALFKDLELTDRLKMKIRQQAASAQVGRRRVSKSVWAAGAAAAALAVFLMVGLPTLERASAPVPAQSPVGASPSTDVGNAGNAGNSGAAGSELSQLVSTPFSTAEEAKASFGADMLAPDAVPEGFALKDIVGAGMAGEPLRDVTFTYATATGDKTITFTASRMTAVFPADLFTATQVNGNDGFVFAQPELTELYWTEDGIQYGIVGHVTSDEAMKIAESAKR